MDAQSRSPLTNRGTNADPRTGDTMILSVCVDLKEISLRQKSFDWTKPSCCPQCRSVRLWGHGFVDAHFDGFKTAIPLRRYRCPDCGCVIKLKPTGYFPRFQATIKRIRGSIAHRLQSGRYLDDLCRHRQRHWFQGLIRQTAARLGNPWRNRLIAAFDRLMGEGHIPISRSV